MTLLDLQDRQESAGKLCNPPGLESNGLQRRRADGDCDSAADRLPPKGTDHLRPCPDLVGQSTMERFDQTAIRPLLPGSDMRLLREAV